MVLWTVSVSVSVQCRQRQQWRGGDEDAGQQRQWEQLPQQDRLSHRRLHLHRAEQLGQQVQTLRADVSNGAGAEGTVGVIYWWLYLMRVFLWSFYLITFSFIIYFYIIIYCHLLYFIKLKSFYHRNNFGQWFPNSGARDYWSGRRGWEQVKILFTFLIFDFNFAFLDETICICFRNYNVFE